MEDITILKWYEFKAILEKKTNKEVPFSKSGLEHPEKADINKNKKISGYEKARGGAIERSIKSRTKK